MSQIAITAKTIFTPLDAIADGVILVEDGTIAAVGARESVSLPTSARLMDLGDRIIAPGFIDVHVHGGGGHDVMEATPEALATVARLAARHGATSFIPTTMTAPADSLLRSLESLGRMICSWQSRGTAADQHLLATPLGIHMEGPFISAARCGVHPMEHLRTPSLALLKRFIDAAGGAARIVTIAPELDGALDCIRAARQLGLCVGLGHSDAGLDDAIAGIDAGGTHAVHTFNAMRPFQHRDTGIIGAVLTDDRIQAEIIADRIHVSSAALQILVRAKGVRNVLLITDGVSATGMGPGQYRLGEIEIFVERQPDTGLLVCRDSEGKLAGSVLTMDAAVRNVITAGVAASLQDAVTMATWNPARLLGIESRKGCLRDGADADIVLLEPDGAVFGTMVAGMCNFT